MNSLISDSVYLRVGKRRQFFFDDLLLEQTQNLTRRFHSPQPAGDRPVLVKDRPWEHVLYFTCNTWNVIRDPAKTASSSAGTKTGGSTTFPEPNPGFGPRTASSAWISTVPVPPGCCTPSPKTESPGKNPAWES